MSYLIDCLVLGYLYVCLRVVLWLLGLFALLLCWDGVCYLVLFLWFVIAYSFEVWFDF